MTELEKKNCLTHLKTSQAAMLDVLENVSDRAFIYKSSPEIWSIAETLEHVIKVESSVITKLQHLRTITPTVQLDRPLTDDKVLELSASRKLKSKAPEPFLPDGIFRDKEDATVVFQQCRNQAANFIAKNNADLDMVVFPHPRIGLLNGKQWLLFISGHSLKHVEQIKDLIQAYLFS